MTLPNILAMSAGSFLLFHLWQQRWRATTASTVLGAGFRAAVAYLRTVALIATIVYGLLFSILGTASFLTPLTVGDLAVAIQYAQDLRPVLASWTNYWSATAFLLLLLGLLFFSTSRATAHWRHLANQFRSRELERLRAQRAAGTWEELPPTAAMQPLLRRRFELYERIRRLSSDPSDFSDGAGLASLQGQVATLTRDLERLDTERRILPFSGEFANSGADRSVGQPSALTTFFISRGLLSTIDAGSRVVLISGLALLLLSLVALTGTVAASAVDQTLLVRFEILHLERTEREALASYTESVPEQEELPPTALSEDDNHGLDFLAARFEHTVGRVLAEATRTAAASSRAAQQLRQVETRQRILRATAHGGQSTRVSALSSLSEVSDLTSLEREGVALFEERPAARPRTELGRQFRRDLENRFVRRSPATWATLRERALQGLRTFQQVATVEDFESRVLSQVLGKALDLPGAPSDAMDNVARELVRQTANGATPRIYEVARAQAFDSLVTTDTFDAAFEQFERRQRAQLRLAPRFTAALDEATLAARHPDSALSKLERQPPALHAARPSSVNPARLSTLVDAYSRSLVRGTGASVRVTLPEALSEFDDYFPGQETGARATLRQQVRDASPMSRAAGTTTGMSGALRPPPSAAFARSRSFGRLRGFSRIGGVLIGRPAENPERRLDVHGLTWSAAGRDRMLLRLTDAGGVSTRVGPFYRSVVHQALGYAADGRPVAVTMTTAAPLQELRILLHPALVDTPLGCRVVALDRFVDEFTGHLPQREELQGTVVGQAALYRVAWANRVRAAHEIEPLSPDDLADPTLASAIQEGLSSNATRDAATTALADVSRLLDRQYSVLAGKPDRFDPDLVAAMARCGTEAAQLSGFEACIRRRSMRPGAATAAWFDAPPQFRVWSGVRETGFSIDSDYEFLRIDDSASGPLEFMLQVAFVDSGRDDRTPWEFPTLAPLIRDAVQDGVRRSAEHAEVLRVAQEFTVLQRLFRLALDGTLGNSFPLHRLVDLAESTAEHVATAPTLRWNVRPGLLESTLAIELQSILAAVEPNGTWQVEMVETLRSCMDLIEESGDLTGLDVDAWRRACDASEFAARAAAACADRGGDATACFLEMGAVLAEQTTIARDMREALDVGRDDELARRRVRGCPPMVLGR